MLLYQGEVRHKQQSRDAGQHRYVESEEAREGGAAHVIAATQKPCQLVSHDRNRGRHVGSDLGRKIRYRVPRQQIPAETKCQRQAEQRDAAQPGQLSRPPERAQEHHAEHVKEGRQDH